MVKAKLLPEKAFSKQLRDTERMLDTLLPILREKRSFKTPGGASSPRYRAWTAWLDAALRAQISGEQCPPLESIVIRVTQANLEAAVTNEDRFVLRLLTPQMHAPINARLEHAYPLRDEPDFDPDGTDQPEILLGYDIPDAKMRARLGRAGRNKDFDLEVVASPEYLVLPPTFSSTAW